MDGCPAIRTTATTMPEAGGSHATLRLMAWLSPAFPVGSFSYSSGLEGAVHEGLVGGSDDLEAWIAALLEHGSGWNDAVLFCEAWRCGRDGRDTDAVAELAEALAGSFERHRETTLQGGAFLAAAQRWPGVSAGGMAGDAPYCVAVGAVAGANGLPLEEACAAFLLAFASNLIQASIRLSVVGQVDAVTVLAALEGRLLHLARRAASSGLDDLGSATMIAEAAAMRHETQYSRLFRS